VEKVVQVGRRLVVALEVGGMTHNAITAKYAAFGLMTIFAISGGAFIIGEALADPGGVAAVLLSLAWAAPTIALASYATWRPGPAAKVLTASAALVAAFVVVDAMFGVVPRDEIGPVGSIAVFAVAVALAFLGVHRPATAGWLLLLVGTVNLGGGASGIAVAVPVLAAGGLYLLATSLEKDADRPTPHERPGVSRTRAVH
jgi:hypothetical protein